MSLMMQGVIIKILKFYKDMDKKQIIVIHGGEAWDTYEEYIEYLENYDFTREKFDKMTSLGWKDNLQKDLGSDFQVVKPKMPCGRNAKYHEWEIWFKKLFPYVNDNVVLVGHSLGANFLAKYLSENTLPVSIDQLHLIAGCYGWSGGFQLPSSLENITEQCNQIYIYHSTDDFVVDFADAKKYKKVLPSARLVQFEDRNHFLQEEFPEIIENIKKS